MSLCYDEINFFIKESTLIYFLTTFTFGGIFLFLFIQSAYSFFEKNRIPRGPLPTPPFGNIKDVVFKRESFNRHLWKYYNRFKRKKYYYAGLYILLKPIVMMMDPFLIYTALNDREKFKNVEGTPKTLGRLKKDDSDVILAELLSKTNDLEKNFNFKSDLNDFFSVTTSTIIGVDCGDLQHIDSTTNNFFYLCLCYSKLKKIGQFSRWDNPRNRMKILINKELDVRKKTDVRKFDLINILTINDDLDLHEFYSKSLEFCQNITQFCLYELCENQDIQQEVIGEIRRFKKENQQITVENFSDLGLLDAVIKETLRLYPPIATVIKRCHQQYKNEKYKLNIPKNCLVAVSIYGIHHDATNFLNPEQFDPDRFCEENAKFMKPCSFLPFGLEDDGEIYGTFITFQVKLALLMVLSKYTVTLKDNEKLEFDVNKLTVAPGKPLNFKFVPL